MPVVGDQKPGSAGITKVGIFMERTLILVKVDGVQRRLVGEILGRFEAKGLKIAGLKFRQFPREVLEEHYGAVLSRCGRFHDQRPDLRGGLRRTGGHSRLPQVDRTDTVERGRPGNHQGRSRYLATVQPRARLGFHGIRAA